VFDFNLEFCKNIYPYILLDLQLFLFAIKILLKI